MLVELEEDRHWWFATRTRAILAYLDMFLGPGDHRRRVLDVGCGAGNMAHHLRHYGRYIGVDINPRPLRVARERGLTVHQGSADALPCASESFDLVALLDTVEHVPNEAGVFSEAYRVLKPGGKLLVTVPAFMFLWSKNDILNKHQRRYTRPELVRKLQEHGFRVLRSSYNNFFIFPLAAAIILARRGRFEPDLASPHFDDEAYQVEMEPTPEPLNTLLHGVGRVEAAVLRRVPFPWGTGIIAIAEK
ncbi:MAG: methyltransferase domain-containing protein [Chloroflexi bacterium]|nr:methyltransferase domain-containing protein [Chloroflexota bacterium]